MKVFSKGIIAFKFAFFLAFGAPTTFADHAPQTKTVTVHEYIKFIEKQKRIPSGLLGAIAKVESRSNPYALNIEGRTLITKNKSEALYHIKRALAEGITNIDVGVMQINWRWHNENFASVEEMLDPKTNIEYAAKLLLALRKQYGDWHAAVRHYHSANPLHYRKYSRKIVLAWLGN